MSYDPTLPEDLASHAEWLRRLARSLLRDAEDAEDLAQEAWVVALESRSRPGAPDRPWLAGVLRNLARFRLRSDVRRRAREQQAAQPSGPSNDSDPLERIEQFRLLADSVERLQDPDRSIVILRYFDGMTSDDIGARLGLSPGAVRMRLKRALENLRERLDREQTDWRVAFAPLAWPTGAPQGAGAGAGSTIATTTGLGIAVSVQRIVAIVFVVALGVVAWQWDPFDWSRDSSEGARSGATAQPSSGAAGVESAQTEPNAGLATTATPPEPESYAWTGVVRDRFTGEPIEGAVVGGSNSLFSAPRIVAHTDADGVYRFRSIPPAVDYLSVRHPRFIGDYSAVDSGERDFHLIPGAEVVGRVLDIETEEPVSSGIVQVYLPPVGGRRGLDPMIAATTPIDGEGRFALAVGLPMLVLEANVDGYRPARSRTIRIDPKRSNEIVLRATRAPRWPGRVVDSQGSPVEGARVEYVPAIPGEEYPGVIPHRPRRYTVTDSTGEYVMEADPGLIALLDVEADGFLGFHEQFVDPGQPAEVVLRRGQAIELRLESTHSYPAVGFAKLYLPGGESRGLRRIAERTYRSYWFDDDVARGRLEIPGYAARSVDWKAGPGLHDLGVLEVEPLAPFVLRVVDESRSPIPRARVAIQATGLDCNDEGRLWLPGAESHHVEVSAPGYVTVLQLVRAGNGEEVEIVLSEGAPLTGRVVDSTGSPVLGATIRLPRDVAHEREHSTGARGHFVVDAVRLGAGFTLEIAHPNHEWTTVAVPEIVAGRPVDLGTIVVGAGRLVTGRVVDESGAAIAGATVRVASPPRRQSRDLPRALTDGRGWFEVRGAPEGEHVLVVDKERFAWHEETIVVGVDVSELRVVLRPTTSYRARVVDDRGEPVPYARVRYSHGVDWLMDRSLSTRTDRDGFFRVDGIPPDHPEVSVALSFGSGRNRVAAPTVTELPDTIVLTPEARLALRFPNGEVERFDLLLERLGRGGSGRIAGLKIVAGEATTPLAPGPYRVSVVDRESGRSSSPVEVVAKAGEEVAVDLVFDEPAFEISVVDPRGEPVSGAKLRVLRVLSDEKRARMRGAASGETDESGVLSCASFEAPAMLITVDPPAGLARCGRRFSLSGGKPTDIRIVLDYEMRLELRVATDAGEALVDGFVRLRLDGASPFYPDHDGKTDAGGSVVFGELEPGKYVVTVSRSDRLVLKRFDLEVSADHPEVREITVPMPFEVDGRILLDGEPAEGGRVSIESSSTSAQVTAGGAFRITALSEDDTVLEYRFDDDVSARQAIAPRRDGGEVRFEFRTVAVRGLVVDSDGRPVPNVRVRLAGPTGEATFHSGEDGRFELSRVPPGRYTGGTWIDGKRVDVQPAVEIGSGAELRVTLERTE